MRASYGEYRLPEVSTQVVRHHGLFVGDSVLLARHRGRRLRVGHLLPRLPRRVRQCRRLSDMGRRRRVGFRAGTFIK